MKNMALLTLLLATSIACPAFGEESDLFVDFWCIGKGTTTSIHFANASTADATVTPTALIGGVVEAALPPLTVPGLGSYTLDIEPEAVAAGGGTAFPPPQLRRLCKTWGALKLRIDGDYASAVSAWGIVRNPDQSFTVNSVAKRSATASALTGLWWRPRPASRVYFALQNAGDQTATVVPEFVSSGRRRAGPTLLVPAGGRAVLVSLKELYPNERASLGSVTFRSTSPGLVGRTFLIDLAAGFSVPLALEAPPADPVVELSSPAAPFGELPATEGFPADAEFYPEILVTNDSQTSLSFTVTVYGADGAALPIPRQSVAGMTGKRISLRDICESGGCSTQSDSLAAVRVRFSAPTQQAHAEVVTTDQSLKFSFYDPMTPTDRAQGTATGISYDLTANQRSRIVLTNATDEPTEPVPMMVFPRSTLEPDGVYLWNLPGLPPNSSQVVDIGMLQLGQEPDVAGRTLPADGLRGFVLMRVPEGVIPSNPTFDPDAGTCYSCPEWQVCFPGAYPSTEGWFDGSLHVALCSTSEVIDMFLSGGIYEALTLGEDADECFFFVCRVLAMAPQCEDQVLIIKKTKFPGGVCPTGISGTAISFRIPFIGIICHEISREPDSQACAPM